MRFEISDEVDRALTTTLVHELVLCKESFERFHHWATLNITGRRDKVTKIKCHDAYASFLHHLYEFYVGCYKRDLQSLKDIPGEKLDLMFNSETKKALHRRTHAIAHGYAPSWENDISYYQVSVPAEFGTQFRRIRNRTAHASIKRANPGTDLSLAQFYKDFHKFIFLLFVDGQAFWQVKDVETFNWRSIEEFDLAVHEQ